MLGGYQIAEIYKMKTQKMKMKTIMSFVLSMVIILSLFSLAYAESGSSEDNKSPQKEFVSLSLTPEKNIAKLGQEVEYTLLIKDLHEAVACIPENLDCGTYKYDLDLSSKNLKGRFELNGKEVNQVLLKSGESEKVSVLVKTESVGSSPFIVNVRYKTTQTIYDSSEEKTSFNSYVKGILLVLGEGSDSDNNGNDDEDSPTEKPNIKPSESEGESGFYQDSSFFMGQGFALNDDESQGKYIDLRILNKDNKLEGKFVVSNSPLKIDGNLDGNNVSFKLFYPDSDESVGVFNGEFKKFDDFLLLRGNLEFKGETYKLTATSTNKAVFREFVEDDFEKSFKTKVKEVIVVTKDFDTSNKNESQDDSTYIRSVEISKEKFLKIIPNPWGKNVIEVEVTENSNVFKEKIKEGESKDIGKYVIEAGQIIDDQDIEFKITKKG